MLKLRKVVKVAGGVFAAALLAGVLASCSCASEQTPTEEPADVPEAVDDEASEPDPSREVEVLVVSKKYESVSGASLDEYQLVTEYTYDDAGRVIASAQSTNYPDANAVNLRQETFAYDDQGRLVSISAAFEQYDWTVGNVTSFAYDDQGQCVSWGYEITSQGVGERSIAYQYDADGRIVAGQYAQAQPGNSSTADLMWSYRDDGMVNAVSVTGGSASLGISFVEGLSDPASGVYVYQDAYGTLATVRLDANGNVESVETQTQQASTPQQVRYEYTTITVKASEFIPTVYSNPTGLAAQWKPQLTEQDIARILGEDAAEA